jgi:acetyltransferase-like isoleucine patch superfamily enzyme
VKIGKNVWISQYVYIDELHPDRVPFGNNCTIGLRTSIFTHFYWGPKRRNYSDGNVEIEDNVFIGPHCVILPNVRIGAGAVIKAGTVVSRDVPSQTFWGLPSAGPLAHVGVPLTHEHSYDEFLKGMRPFRKKQVGLG